MIGTRIANFQITQELGTGGMGTVYKAKDVNLNRYVALKMLHNHIMANSNSYKRFKNEAQISAQVSHANVAMLYDFIEYNGKSYIIMEYVDGHTLEKELQLKNILTESECINITVQTLKGLSEAHQLDILHRDLKPSNLMIKKNGYVKLMDFGIARMENATRLTAQNKVVGTIEYMAPEILKGQDPNRTSDLYAVGVMMHEMLTGKTLYKGKSEASLMYQIVNEKPNYDFKNVNPGLARIIKKLVKKNPQHRYRNTTEVIGDLEKISRSIAAKNLSPKVSLPNVDVSKIKDLVKLPAISSLNGSMSKGMKFILFSVLLSLAIIFIGMLSSDVKPNDIFVDESKLNFDIGKDNESDLSPSKNITKQIDFSQPSETDFKPQGIEITVPKKIEKKGSDSQNKSQPKSPKKKSQATPSQSKIEKKKEPVIEKKNEAEAKEVAKPSQRTKYIEIEKQETPSKDDVKEIVEEESMSKNIEVKQKEREKEAVDLYVGEQFLPIVFGKVVNSKNHNEGDMLEFKSAKSISIGSNVVIENGAPVRAKVSRKKVKNNGKVIFGIQILSVQAVNGDWIALNYPEYSDIQKGAVIIPATTRIGKVKLKPQQITIYK